MVVEVVKDEFKWWDWTLRKKESGLLGKFNAEISLLHAYVLPQSE